MKLKQTTALILTALLLPLTACSSEQDQLANKAIDITLNGDTASCEADGVQIQEGQITITSHGIYRISGTLTDGQILVDCSDTGEVWLLLNGVEITSTTGACIYVKQADLTHISLEKDTVNTLTDGTNYTFDPGDDEPDGTIFARDDLMLQGEGSLVIDANFKNAIAAKDDLTIADGTYDIVSVGHGIKGKDSLSITGGKVYVIAEGDGLKATNAEGGSKGVITITGGTVEIDAGDEGIQAISDITITGGRVTVDSRNNGIRSETALIQTGGELVINAEDTPVDVPAENRTGGILTIDGVAR